MGKILNICKNQQGFTLVEVLVTLVIVGILATVATGIIHLNTQTYVQIMDRSILMIEGRNAMRIIIADLQKICPDSIQTMKPHRLVFSDIDGNSVEFQYLNNSIVRNNHVIAKYVQHAPFKYLDINKKSKNNPAKLNFIRITIELQREDETVSLEEMVYVRNKSKV